MGRLPATTVLGLEVRVAVGFRARLLGLARLEQGEVGAGLLIPRCASVHTFGMRFRLDLYFLDEAGSAIAMVRDVPPKRVVAHRGVAAVLELPTRVDTDNYLATVPITPAR